MRRPTPRPSRLLLLLAALIGALAGAPAGASAQEVDSATAEPSELQSTLDSLAALDRTLATLEGWQIGREGQDGRLLDRRRDAAVEAREGLLLQLGELVTASASEGQAGSGAEASALVARVDSLLADAAEQQVEELQALAEEASNTRLVLEGLSGADRAGPEREVARLDAAIQEGLADYHALIVERQELGADVAGQLERLDQALLVRAELLAARIQESQEDIQDIRERMRDGETGLEAEVPALGRRVTRTASELEGLVVLMDQRELQTAPYRQVLLLATGDLSAETLDAEVLRSIVAGWMSQLGAWVAANWVGVFFKALVLLVILAVTWVASKVVRGVVSRATHSSRFNMSALLQETLVRWSGRVVVLLGVLVALSQIGVDLAPVLAGLGVAGFIVGFALQDSLANFAAGAMILLYRPFDEGDVVDVGGVVGKIHDLSLTSTTILSFDNQLYVVPNSKIWGDVIKNVTARDTRRVDLTFGIGYADDIPEAERILSEVVASNPLVLDDPEPVVKVSELGDSSVNFVVRPWCRTEDYWEVYWGLTRAVKMRFDAEGISIPFPQRDIHVYHETGGVEPSERGAPAASE